MSSEEKQQPSDQPPPLSYVVTPAAVRGRSSFPKAGVYMTHRMPPQNIRITLELTPEAGKALDDLAESTGQDVSSLFRKSLALYKLAMEATKEGKAVGVAATPDVLETKFEGL